MFKYNIGDTVKIIGEKEGYRHPIGTEGVIKDRGKLDGEYYYKVTANNYSCYYCEKDLEKRQIISVSEDSFGIIVSCLSNSKIEAEKATDETNAAFIKAVSKALEELKINK